MERFPQFESSNGEILFINPRHVVLVGPVMDKPGGAVIVNETGIILVTGSALRLKGTPVETAAELEYGPEE